MSIHPVTQALIEEIGAFLAATGMSKTAFGWDALRDSKFIPDLENGRDPSLRTMDKVRAFMRDRRGVAA